MAAIAPPAAPLLGDPRVVPSLAKPTSRWSYAPGGRQTGKRLPTVLEPAYGVTGNQAWTRGVEVACGQPQRSSCGITEAAVDGSVMPLKLQRFDLGTWTDSREDPNPGLFPRTGSCGPARCGLTPAVPGWLGTRATPVWAHCPGCGSRSAETLTIRGEEQTAARSGRDDHQLIVRGSGTQRARRDKGADVMTR